MLRNFDVKAMPFQTEKRALVWIETIFLCVKCRYHNFIFDVYYESLFGCFSWMSLHFLVTLMFSGAVFVTMAYTVFLFLRTACLVLKSVFIQRILTRHKNQLSENRCSAYQWLSEFGTQAITVTLLHTVTVFIVKGSMLIWCFCSEGTM